MEVQKIHLDSKSVQNIKEIINTLKNEIEIIKVQLSNITSNSVTQQSSETNRNLSRYIIENFKEHWDIKMKIKSLEDENISKQEMIKKGLFSENINSLLQDIKKNEDNKNDLLQKLYFNMKDKKQLQTKIMEIQDGSNKELLQLQIQVRSLKLEKLELMEKNSNFKIEAEKAIKENNEKDQIINKMKIEIESMKTKLNRQKSAPSGIRVFSPIKEEDPLEKDVKALMHRPTCSLQNARLAVKIRNKNKYFGKTIENFLKAYTGQREETTSKKTALKAHKNLTKQMPIKRPQVKSLSISPIHQKGVQKKPPIKNRQVAPISRVLNVRDQNAQSRVKSLTKCI